MAGSLKLKLNDHLAFTIGEIREARVTHHQLVFQPNLFMIFNRAPGDLPRPTSPDF